MKNLSQNHSFIVEDEFVLFVQASDGRSSPLEIAERIVAYRDDKTASSDRQKFRIDALSHAAATAHRPVKIATLTSYADVAFRHYHDSGIMVRRFRNNRQILELASTPEALAMAHNLAQMISPWNALENPIAYLSRLYEGQNTLSEKRELGDILRPQKGNGEYLAKQLQELLNKFREGDVFDVKLQRVASFDTEVLMREQHSACHPSEDWTTVKNLAIGLQNGEDTDICELKRPALMEWCVFKAVIAILGAGNMKGSVGSARRFNIAADGLPVSVAPGNGPDMIFTCSNGFTVIAEATLTTSSRQTATEAESVRRHTAEITSKSDDSSPVVTMFVAPEIDLNTAEWLRHGSHWLNGVPVQANVVPLTIEQLFSLGDKAIRSGNGNPNWLSNILQNCLDARSNGVVEWLLTIEQIVKEAVNGEDLPKGKTESPNVIRFTKKSANATPAPQDVVFKGKKSSSQGVLAF